MEFGRKMMTLQWSPSRWPISSQKVALICLNLNFAAKKKATETKIFEKSHSEGRNDGVWPKYDEHPTESYPLTLFQSKSCTNLWKSKFWRKKKKEHQNENFQKNVISEADTMEFGQKMVNILWSLACWSFINLRDSKFQCKRKKRSTETKIFVKCHFGGRNDGIWPKNDDSPIESFPLSYV